MKRSSNFGPSPWILPLISIRGYPPLTFYLVLYLFALYAVVPVCTCRPTHTLHRIPSSIRYLCFADPALVVQGVILLQHASYWLVWLNTLRTLLCPGGWQVSEYRDMYRYNLLHKETGSSFFFFFFLATFTLVHLRVCMVTAVCICMLCTPPPPVPPPPPHFFLPPPFFFFFFTPSPFLISLYK